MSRQIFFTAKAWVDYVDWQGQDKKTLRRINTLIDACSRTPFDGIGKPEPLPGEREIPAVRMGARLLFFAVCGNVQCDRTGGQPCKP